MTGCDEQAALKSHDGMADMRKQMFENALSAHKQVASVMGRAAQRTSGAARLMPRRCSSFTSASVSGLPVVSSLSP